MNRFFLEFCLCVFATLGGLAQGERVLYDGGNASGWSCQYPTELVSENFDYEELWYDTEAKALDWRYRRHGAEELSQELVRFAPCDFSPAQQFVVEMRNLGGASVGVTCGVRFPGEEGVGWNADCLRVYHPQRELPNDGEWHELVFDCVQYGPLAQEGFTKPFLDIRTNHFPKDTDMHFQIRKVVARDAQAIEAVLATAVEMPENIVAGETLHFPELRVRFAGLQPTDPRAWLEIVSVEGNMVPVRVPFDDITVEADGTWLLGEVDLPLTRYLFEGEYLLKLHCGEVVPSGASWRRWISGRKPGAIDLSRTEVREYRGAPILHINGEPYPGMMRATYAPGSIGAKAFYESGLRVLGFCGNANEQGFFLSRSVAVAPGKFDWAEFDTRAQETLAVAPEAYLMPRIYLSAPEWWLREHPEAIVVEERLDASRRAFHYDGARACPSWFSPAWQEYCAECLAQLIEHIRRTPYADRVIGFVLASGSTEEWDSWSGVDSRWVDYSPAARDSFRAWLKAKYATDTALQTAWKTGNATLETVELPPRSERTETIPAYADLRSESATADLRAMDYYHWTAEATADCIAALAHAVKTASENRLVCGPFYGYSLELTNSPRLHNSGHLGVWKLLENPDVDFLCSPADYRYRHGGNGGEDPEAARPGPPGVVNPWYLYRAGTPMALGEHASLRLHNKFWFIEMDYRTSETPCPEDFCGKSRDLQGDCDQQEKVAVHTLCTGMTQWWFDVGYVRFANSRLLACIRNIMRAVEEGIRNYDRSSAAEIAMIVDERSLIHARVGGALPAEMLSLQIPYLERLGNTVEYYLAEDLERLPDRIRLIFVTTSFAPTEKQAEALRRLRKDGRVIFYLYAPGVVPFRDGLTSSQAMQEFSGMPLAVDFRAATARAVIDSPDGKYLPAKLRGAKLVENWHHIDRDLSKLPSLNPFVYAKSAQPNTRILAHYGDGRGAMAVYEGGEWTGIWSGIDELPRELLVAAVEKAGVHRYCTEPALVWAAQGMLGVCVEQGGDYTLRLKRPAALRDALTNETFTTDDAGVFSAPFRNNQTRLFFYEK